VNGPRDLPNDTISQAHYQKGVEAIFRDDLYAAARELDEVRNRKVSKYSLISHARMAEVWAELDYADFATRELGQVGFLESDVSHGVNTTAVERYYAEAAEAAVARDFLEALNLRKRITEEVPTNADAWVDLGLSYERLLRLEEAANSYRQAINIDPSKASAFFRLGMVAAASKNLDAATEAFGRLARLRSQNATFK
jgi:tetratricopeptide (TPR) repeat protein